jgi:hypothetical protein
MGRVGEVTGRTIFVIAMIACPIMATRPVKGSSEASLDSALSRAEHTLASCYRNVLGSIGKNSYNIQHTETRLRIGTGWCSFPQSRDRGGFRLI